MLNVILQQAQQGDREALAKLCHDFQGLIYKVTNQRYLKSIYDDALATAYLSFVEAVYSYDLASAVPFAGYAKSKVKFSVWNLFKKERRRWQRELSNDIVTEAGIRLIEEFSDPNDSAVMAVDNILTEQLIKLLGKLPARQQQVINYLVFEARGITEIANCMNLSPQAVYSLKKTACRSLKKQGFYLYMGNK